MSKAVTAEARVLGTFELALYSTLHSWPMMKMVLELRLLSHTLPGSVTANDAAILSLYAPVYLDADDAFHRQLMDSTARSKQILFLSAQFQGIRLAKAFHSAVADYLQGFHNNSSETVNKTTSQVHVGRCLIRQPRERSCMSPHKLDCR